MAYILSIGVVKHHRRHGIGNQLFICILSFLEVSVKDVGAQNLLTYRFLLNFDCR